MVQHNTGMQLCVVSAFRHHATRYCRRKKLREVKIFSDADHTLLQTLMIHPPSYARTHRHTPDEVGQVSRELIGLSVETST